METAGIKPPTMRAIQYRGYGGGSAALKYVEIPVPLLKKDEVLIKVEAVSINPADLTDIAGEIVEVGSAVCELKVGDKVVSKQKFWYVEIPVPSLKKDEVLIKVEAASINPADCRIQKGLLRPFLPKFPFIPVTDVAGEIAEVGTEVRELKVGDKVVSKLIFWKADGLAEYVAASESVTVIRPACVSAADAAGLPMAGLTALQALKAIGTKFDGTGSASNILITAASGGIGSYAVQLAKLGNHNVTATCGARNLELVESIGADEVLDYKTPEGAALKNTSGKKYDYIVNTTNGGKWSAFKPSLSSHGRVVHVSSNFGNFVASILTLFSKNKLSTVNLSLGMEDLSFLLELVKEGKLKMVLDSQHPFEKAADAWEKSLSGHATGKVIVEM